MTAGQEPGYCLSSTMRNAHVNSVISCCHSSSWRRAASRSGIAWSRSTCQARRATATASGTETANLPYSSPSNAFRTARSADWARGAAPRGETARGCLPTAAPGAIDRVVPRAGEVRAPGPEGRAHRLPLSARTVRYIHTIISAALAAAVEDEAPLLERNPAVKAKPPSAKEAKAPEMHPWDASQLGDFLDWSADKSPLHAPWHVLAMTGMRRGELLALRWRDIDLDAGTIASAARSASSRPRGSPSRSGKGRPRRAGRG